MTANIGSKRARSISMPFWMFTKHPRDGSNELVNSRSLSENKMLRHDGHRFCMKAAVRHIIVHNAFHPSNSRLDDHRARLASYQNSLFLPHPQPPNISPVVPELPHTTTVPSHGSFGRLSRIADSPKRHSAIHELGDSGDDDEGVSEADRDARIA